MHELIRFYKMSVLRGVTKMNVPEGEVVNWWMATIFFVEKFSIFFLLTVSNVYLIPHFIKLLNYGSAAC